MDPAINLRSLSDYLNSVAGTSGEGLPQAINSAITTWLGDNIFQFLWTVMIFVVFAFVFYGAFLYFTAYGDENRALMAKKTITYAFVGLAIAASAIGITMYVHNILVHRDYDANKPLTAPVKNSTDDAGSGTSGSP